MIIFRYEILRLLRRRAFALTALFVWSLGAYFSIFLMASYNSVVQRAVHSSQFLSVEVPRFEQFVVNSYFQTMSFILLLSLSFLIAPLIASDREDGTLRYLKLRGVSTTRYLLSKIMVSIVFLLFLIGVASTLPFVWVYFGYINISIITVSSVSLFIGLFFYAMLALSISSINDKASSSILISLLTLLLLFSSSTLREFFPTSWFVLVDQISPGTFWRESFSGLFSVADSIGFVLRVVGLYFLSVFLLSRSKELW